MGCFDGAEVRERVSTYILNKDTFQHHPVGFYRGDVLTVVKGSLVQKLNE